jgi:hypothetical protein
MFLASAMLLQLSRDRVLVSPEPQERPRQMSNANINFFENMKHRSFGK